MSGRGSRFGLRPAPPAGGVRRGQPGLRVATDTILAPRAPARPAATAAPRAPGAIFVAALMVATTSLAAALIRHVAVYELGGAELFRFSGIVMPILAGVLTLLILSGRRIARSRALAGLAITGVRCPILLGIAGPGLIGVMTMISGALAFVALAIALDWLALSGGLGATRAGAIVAAAQLGTMLGDAMAQSSGPPPLGVCLILIGVVGPVGYVAAFRRQPEPDSRPSLAASQAMMTNYPLLGMLAAAVAATAAGQLLGRSMPFVALGDESAGLVRAVILPGTLIALLAGGFLADRFARDDRGYAVWFAATLGLASAVAFLSERLGLVEAGYAILLARLLPYAGIGAALALIIRRARPAARLGALIAFLAARTIGLAVVAPMIARAEPGLEFDAMGYGAIGLLIAAAAVCATMPKRGD